MTGYVLIISGRTKTPRKCRRGRNPDRRGRL